MIKSIQRALALLLCVMVCVSMLGTFASAEDAGDELNNNSIEVISIEEEPEKGLYYEDEVMNAYAKLTAYYEALGQTVTASYDEFVAAFDASGEKIDAFLANYIPETNEGLAGMEPGADAEINASGDQAWYYDTGTSLPRAASYSANNLLSVVKKGDILYETKGEFAPLVGHCALIEGVFWSVAQNQFYIRVVEAIQTGVVRSVFETERLEHKGDIILRVPSATHQQKHAAVDFAISQLGASYVIDLQHDTSANESDWYCSELVWAAYKRQGIDLETSDTTAGIVPKEIYVSTLTSTISVSSKKPASYFTDISGHWGANSITYIVNNGLMRGISTTVFSPDTAMTRAMLVTILYRLEGCPTPDRNNDFSDVTNTKSYYYDAVSWADRKNIVTGYKDGTFRPSNSVTRQEMATFLYRYAIYKGYSTASSSTSLNQFTDRDDVSSWALAAMRWAVSKGVMNGVTSTTLCPKVEATRAQTAKIIQNLLQKIM